MLYDLYPTEEQIEMKNVIRVYHLYRGQAQPRGERMVVSVMDEIGILLFEQHRQPVHEGILTEYWGRLFLYAYKGRIIPESEVQEIREKIRALIKKKVPHFIHSVLVKVLIYDANEIGEL